MNPRTASFPRLLCLLLTGLLTCILPTHGHAQAGSLDATFNPGTGTSSYSLVESVAVQGDGKVVLGGWFTQVNGVARNHIARLNADGSVDAGFNPGAGADDRVRSVAVQGDGKVVLGGFFSTVHGAVRYNIARLNADGSVDATFNPGTGTSSYSLVESVAVQGDGKVVLGGWFTQVNGVARNHIARLNADGSVDAGFNPGAGADSLVESVAVQGDGKVVLGGDFTQVNGVARTRVARLNADGSVDAGFDPGAGADFTVVSVAVQGDGKVVLGGNFSTVNGVARNGVARLNGDTPPPAIPPFFNGAVDVGAGFSYLPSFGYFKLLPQSPGYVYHNDLGFLYYIDAQDGKGGAYFYDFATTAAGKSLGFFYTSPSFPFPYLYSFELQAFLYYLPDTQRGSGFYTSAPRVFVRLDTGEFLFQ